MTRIIPNWGLTTILLLAFRIVGATEHPAAAGECSRHSADHPLTEAFGSAALLANLRSAPDSIRVVAKRLLAEALDAGEPRMVDCPAGCGPATTAVVYKVAPTAYLDQVKQRTVCLELERQTTETPLVFTEKHFATLNELNDWIMNFSRGKGREGRKLYRLCSSNCSPRYTFLIERGGADLSISPAVMCGPARDRSNKRYSLSTALRSRCADAP